jgi:hypothetical protein
MPRSPWLLVALAACSGHAHDSNGDADDSDDSDGGGTTAGGVVTVAFPNTSGTAAPLFAAIDLGDGWVVLDVTGDRVDVPVPAGATSYRLLSACTGRFGAYEVDWLLADVADVPIPPVTCPTTDSERSVTVTGTVANTADLVHVSLGPTADTVSSSQLYGLNVVPGTYDLVATQLQGGDLVAVPDLAITGDQQLAELDFADAVAPDAYTLAFTGTAPLYVAVHGVTANGTTFDAGDQAYGYPPASTGVTIAHQWVFTRSTTDEQYAFRGAIDGPIAMDVAAATPYAFDAAVNGATIDVGIDAPDLDLTVTSFGFQGQAGESVVRVQLVHVDGAVSLPVDPTSELPEFPSAIADAFTSGAAGTVESRGLVRLGASGTGTFGLPLLLSLPYPSGAGLAGLPDEPLDVVITNGTAR